MFVTEVTNIGLLVWPILSLYIDLRYVLGAGNPEITCIGTWAMPAATPGVWNGCGLVCTVQQLTLFCNPAAAVWIVASIVTQGNGLSLFGECSWKITAVCAVAVYCLRFVVLHRRGLLPEHNSTEEYIQ